MGSGDLDKGYDPSGIEEKWYKYWLDNKSFSADDNSDKPSFSIVIPPPNVTGSLHMGHAFNTALIDTVVRFQRLRGKNVLCLPGTDHASIAVQTIPETGLGEAINDRLRRGTLLSRESGV